MANVYKMRPSALFCSMDEYTAYCFDEACAFIIRKIENGEEPIFPKETKEYGSFSAMYARFNSRK